MFSIAVYTEYKAVIINYLASIELMNLGFYLDLVKRMTHDVVRALLYKLSLNK